MNAPLRKLRPPADWPPGGQNETPERSAAPGFQAYEDAQSSDAQYPAGFPISSKISDIGTRWARAKRIAAARRGDLIRLVEHWRQDGVLPPDPAGLADVAANALIFKYRQDLRAVHILDLLDDLVTEAEARRATARALRRYADQGPEYELVRSGPAGERTGLTREERQALVLRTMRAVDEPEHVRRRFQVERRREQDRERKRRARDGARAARPPTLTESEPWARAGRSRSGWYRDRAALADAINHDVAVLALIRRAEETGAHLTVPRAASALAKLAEGSLPASRIGPAIDRLIASGALTIRLVGPPSKRRLIIETTKGPF